MRRISETRACPSPRLPALFICLRARARAPRLLHLFPLLFVFPLSLSPSFSVSHYISRDSSLFLSLSLAFAAPRTEQVFPSSLMSALALIQRVVARAPRPTARRLCLFTLAATAAASSMNLEAFKSLAPARASAAAVFSRGPNFPGAAFWPRDSLCFSSRRYCLSSLGVVCSASRAFCPAGSCFLGDAAVSARRLREIRARLAGGGIFSKFICFSGVESLGFRAIGFLSSVFSIAVHGKWLLSCMLQSLGWE